MQNEELLELTASERLTLEEEAQNQVSWREDPNSESVIETPDKREAGTIWFRPYLT
jgi:hypothetical protein